MNQDSRDLMWQLFWMASFVFVGFPVYCICSLLKLTLHVILVSVLLVVNKALDIINSGMDIPAKIVQEFSNATPLPEVLERIKKNFYNQESTENRKRNDSPVGRKTDLKELTKRPASPVENALAIIAEMKDDIAKDILESEERIANTE